jgi:methylmalonyl-CoA/ethylmalonyl-CoA epimerase
MNEIIKTDKIDHIGIVVPNIEKALEHYKNVFNKIGSKPIISETQNVKISFIEFSNIKLELIEPISEKSPISNFLKKNPLGGMHHVGLEVDDLNNTYSDAKNNDLKPLSKPVKGYHGRDLFFLHPKKMMNTLFEILSKN